MANQADLDRWKALCPYSQKKAILEEMADSPDLSKRAFVNLIQFLSISFMLCAQMLSERVVLEIEQQALTQFEGGATIPTKDELT